MSSRQFLNGSVAALVGAGAIALSLASAQAAMLPMRMVPESSVQRVDCAIGAHIGPVGGCILGNDNPPAVVQEAPAVIVERPVDAPPPDGCATKSVTTTDGMGNSQTRSKTNC
jgi:hypothetical protein